MDPKIMMTAAEVSLLQEVVSSLAKDSVILEIGTARGGSSKVMAETNPYVKIFTIDLFEDNGLDHGAIQELYTSVSNSLSKFSNITVMCGNAMHDFQGWNTHLDMYLEDGAHFDPALITNLTRWLSFLKPNGLLLMHDNNTFCPDVGRNIDKLVNSNEFTIVKTVESLTVLKRKEQ